MPNSSFYDLYKNCTCSNCRKSNSIRNSISSSFLWIFSLILTTSFHLLQAFSDMQSQSWRLYISTCEIFTYRNSRATCCVFYCVFPNELIFQSEIVENVLFFYGKKYLHNKQQSPDTTILTDSRSEKINN